MICLFSYLIVLSRNVHSPVYSLMSYDRILLLYFAFLLSGTDASSQISFRRHAVFAVIPHRLLHFCFRLSLYIVLSVPVRCLPSFSYEYLSVFIYKVVLRIDDVIFGDYVMNGVKEIIVDDVMNGEVDDDVLLLSLHRNQSRCGISALLETTFTAQTHQLRQKRFLSNRFGLGVSGKSLSMGWVVNF